MNLIKIKEQIEIEKSNLKKITNVSNEELDFFNSKISKEILTSTQGLINLDSINVMTAYLLSINNSLPPETIHDYIKSNELLIKPGLLEEKEIVFKCLENALKKETGILERKLNELLKKKIKKLNPNNVDLDKFIKLYELYEKELIKALGIFTSINTLKESYLEEQAHFEEFKQSELAGFRISDKRKEKIVKEVLGDSYEIKLIVEDLSVIGKYYEKIAEEDKKIKRTARKSIAKYANLIPILNSLNDKKIADKYIITNIIDMIDNEEILKDFLIELSKDQEKQFKELSNKYKKLSNDNKKIIQTIFNKYNLDFNKLPNELKNKILNQETESIEDILNKIKELEISSFEIVCYILEYSTKEILNDYINLIKNGIFTKEFIISNKEILSQNKELNNNYEQTIKKLELLHNEKINSRIFINDQNIYLIDYNQLKNNIDILKQYNLLHNINKLNTFELLKNDDLDTKIDIYLELGYEKILENNLVLLNYDLKTIKKLYILKSLNMLPVEINGLINIMNNDNFLEYIDDIDNYIFNVVNYRIDTSVIKEQEINLEKYFLNSNNSRTIEINGINLSKNRIKRNLLKLEKIDLSEQEKELYALIYGAILTEEEYNNIISSSKEIIKHIN